MTVLSLIAIYFVVWWTILFAVLPFGVKSQAETGAVEKGTDPGAPTAPLMLKKLLWTTIVSAIIFGVSWWAYLAGYLTVDRLYRLMGFTN